MRKKELPVVFLYLLILIITIGSASAVEETTQVSGVTYQGELTNYVPEADVEVTCNHNGTNHTKSTTSNLMGMYFVTFDIDECDYGDEVTVKAQKDGLTGEEQGSIIIEAGDCCKNINVAMVNVPLVPEFGVFVGALTLLSAVGVFFVIRGSSLI